MKKFLLKSQWLQKKRVPLFCMILTGSILFASCREEKPEPPTPDPEETTIQYFTFNQSVVNDLEISQEDSYQYNLSTTGTDPFVYLNALTNDNDPDSVVLTFEYQCSAYIDFQIFFGSPVTGERSCHSSLNSATDWTTFSFDLNKEIESFDWGATGDFLRFDFGTQSGVNIKIRNIYLREQKEEEKEKENYELSLKTNLEEYLSADYDSRIERVSVGTESITVSGSYTGEGSYSLCEVSPYEDVTQVSDFSDRISLANSSFSVELDRFVDKDEIHYDRLLSKWVIVKTDNQGDKIVSHARYADVVSPVNTMTKRTLSGKKGLVNFYSDRDLFEADLDDLQISSLNVGITITDFMYLTPSSSSIAYSYGNKTYYFSRYHVAQLDQTLQAAQNRNIFVAATILIKNAAESIDAEIGNLLQHPDYTGNGIYAMPNMTTPEGVNCYAAALDFLASRYCCNGSYGRIDTWILHNEVDYGTTWTNMGEKPMLLYMDTYIKSLRMCYNIARNYDEHSEVLASFTHSWTEVGSGGDYAARDMINTLKSYTGAEGDFQWGLAYHSYPQEILEPKTWNDEDATFSMDTPYITFKNLEVLDAWAKTTENKYKGTIKRTVLLSENGTNSPSYSETDLGEQAAGLAYAWKKLGNLDGIDAMQWYDWLDRHIDGEGLRLGLRRFLDDASDPGGEKPVWYVYQAAGTDQENNVFENYKSIIGITDWNEIFHNVTP